MEEEGTSFFGFIGKIISFFFYVFLGVVFIAFIITLL